MRPEERRELILEVVENQLRDDNPPETRRTLQRLMAEGTSREEAMRLIACVVAGEIFDLLSSQTDFDLPR